MYKGKNCIVTAAEIRSKMSQCCCRFFKAAQTTELTGLSRVSLDGVKSYSDLKVPALLAALDLVDQYWDWFALCQDTVFG